MKATNIKWDVDSPDELKNLPAEIEIPANLKDEEKISDYISDLTGYCHYGFELEPKPKSFLTIREYNQTIHKQTKNADVFIARLDSAVQKSGHYAEVMKQLECIGYSEDTVKVIRTALDQYRNMRKQEAQAAAYPAQTPLELVAQLRKIGISNGSSLGYHCGIADEAADWIEERVREEQQGRVIHLPCAVGDTVYRICPQAKHIQIGQMWSGKVVKSPCDRCPWSCCSCVNIGFQPDAPQFEHIVKPIVFQHVHNIIQAMPYFGTVFFTDEESAKAYLEERMGEQND